MRWPICVSGFPSTCGPPAGFPEYIDVGTDVFYEAYDWHVRHQQPLQLSRQAGSRVAIVFMFTQLVLRPEQERTFIGVPYDGA